MLRKSWMDAVGRRRCYSLASKRPSLFKKTIKEEHLLPMDNIRSLWYAVLKEFMDRLQELTESYELNKNTLYGTKYLQAIREERRWLNSEKETPGSFHWICDLLEFDPLKTRNHIIQTFPLLSR